MIVSVFVFWTLWAFIFGSFAKSDDPNAFIHRATGWLLRGSILELLIAVPSHIIVRRRGDCCAPIGTFWGITTGISVMLLCFGPAFSFCSWKGSGGCNQNRQLPPQRVRLLDNPIRSSRDDVCHDPGRLTVYSKSDGCALA